MSLEAFPVVAQTVQTQNLVDLSLSGNTAGALALMSSGTVTIAGGNNVTLSQAGNAFTISAFNQSVQTQNNVDVTLSGNTSGALALVSSGTLTIAGGNNITLSQAGNAVTISGPNTVAQSVQTQNCVDVTLAGNTSGVLAMVSSGTLTLAGGNNITLSQAGNAVTISAFSQTVQTQSLGSDTMGMSNLGNTSGTTGVVSGSNVLLALAGGNNITLSQSINGSSVTITISAFSQTVQTQNAVDVTLAGNTSGALALVSSGTLTLAGGNNITLSQAGNAITISAGASGAGGPTLSLWQNMVDTITWGGTTHNTLYFFPIAQNFVFPGNMTVNTARLHITCNMSVTNASSQAHTYTVLFGLYTMNGSTLSLYNSASTSFGSGNTNRSFSTMYNQARWLTFNSSQFSNSSLTLAAGSHYFGAILMRSSGTNHAFSWGGAPLGLLVGDAFLGTVGTSAATPFAPFWAGLGMTSTTGPLPASMAVSNLSHDVAGGAGIYDIQFDNYLSSF